MTQKARNKATRKAKDEVAALERSLLDVRYATITFEGGDQWRFQTEDGYNVVFRSEGSHKSAALSCITWVRNVDWQLGRMPGNRPRFTVVEWLNTPRGWKPPVWKEIN